MAKEKMPDAEGYKEVIKEGIYKPVAERLDPDVVQSVRQTAQNQGEAPPTLLLDTTRGKDPFAGDRPLPSHAAAERTNDNTPYITMNDGFLKESPDTQKVVLRHEQSHLAHDTKAQDFATLLNEPDIEKARQTREAAADKEAVCTTPGLTPERAAQLLAGFYENGRASKIQHAKDDNPDLTNAQAEKLADTDRGHPDMRQRVSAVLSYPQQCTMPTSATPTPGAGANPPGQALTK